MKPTTLRTLSVLALLCASLSPLNAGAVLPPAVDGNTLIVNGKKIRLTAEKDPANLKWNEIGADIVIECTGFFLTKDTCQKHIDAGAKKVEGSEAPPEPAEKPPRHTRKHKADRQSGHESEDAE